MTAFIRSLCLAALLAAGSAWAQQQPADNPDNPHSTQAKDKQGSGVPSSTSDQQAAQAENPNPHHPDNRDAKAAGTASQADIDAAERDNPQSPQNKDRDRVGSAAGMDHDAMMKNATPQMILQKLHMANLEEIEMGKLAEQNGTDRVKSYAKTLQTDHTAADGQVKALAQKKNITLSDSPKNPEMQKKMDEAKNRFSNMKGAEFDRAFGTAMYNGHDGVLKMLKDHDKDIKSAELRKFVDDVRPTLEHHKDMADKIQGKAPGAQGRAPEMPPRPFQQ